MKRLLSLFVITLCVFSASFTFAAHGHYSSGAEGLKAGTLPPEGFYYKAYATFYNADEFRDGRGKKVDGFDASVFGFVNRFIYSSDIKVLGGNLIFDVIIPVVNSDVSVGGVSENNFNVGDICIEPFLIAWHDSWYDAVVGVGLYLPTGDFDMFDPASTGKGYWTGMLSAGGTIYFDTEKTWHASLVARYEVHTEQDDTNIRPGDDFSFEWAIGKTVNKTIDIGIAGYCQWQLDKDSNSMNTDLHRAFAVGPEVSVAIPEWQSSISLRVLYEFENQNSSQGNLTVLSFTKAF